MIFSACCLAASASVSRSLCGEESMRSQCEGCSSVTRLGSRCKCWLTASFWAATLLGSLCAVSVKIELVLWNLEFFVFTRRKLGKSICRKCQDAVRGRCKTRPFSLFFFTGHYLYGDAVLIALPLDKMVAEILHTRLVIGWMTHETGVVLLIMSHLLVVIDSSTSQRAQIERNSHMSIPSSQCSRIANDYKSISIASHTRIAPASISAIVHRNKKLCIKNFCAFQPIVCQSWWGS